jgi:hypothetical protein
MTQNNYRYLFILGIFSIFLMALGCEQDDGYIQTQNEEQNGSRYKIEIIGKEKVNSNTPLSNKLKSLMPKKVEKKSTSTSGREIYSSEYGMTVNTDYVKFIEDVTTGYHSYNFPVYLDSLQDGTLRNLILSLNPNGYYDAFIVDYGILISDLTNSNQNIYPTSNATMHSIDFDASAVIAAKKDYPHYECTFEWGPEHWQHPCYEENAADCITQDLISWECIVVSGGGSGSPGDTSNDGTNSSNGGSGLDSNTGGGGGGGTQNPENPDYDPTDPDVHGNGGQPVLTAPVFEEPEQEEEEDNCNDLHEKSTSAFLTSEFLHLGNEVNANIEKGYALKASNGVAGFDTEYDQAEGDSRKIIFQPHALIFAIMHTHPTGADAEPMFGPGDLKTLHDMYQNFNPPPSYTYNTSIFTVYMVIDGYVYAIKVDDVAAFEASQNIFYDVEKYRDFESSLESLYDDSENTNNHNNLAKVLLGIIEDLNLGISIYRSPEEDIGNNPQVPNTEQTSNWTKLGLADNDTLDTSNTCN